MNKFCEIIYHPSRFVLLVCLNILICRYLNGVIDASKTEKSFTLSITIWGYPSRFSHYTLSDTAYHCWKLAMASERKVTVSWYETFCSIPWNCLFQAEKHFVSPCETSRFSVLLPHPIARSFALLVNESGFFCIIISRKTWGITPNRDG